MSDFEEKGGICRVMINNRVCRIMIIVADQTGWKLVLVTNEANRAGLLRPCQAWNLVH